MPPLPNPRKNEKKAAFISRFMSETKNEKNMTRDQRLAVAYKQWKEKGNDK